jgi:hypothetical protein
MDIRTIGSLVSKGTFKKRYLFRKAPSKVEVPIRKGTYIEQGASIGRHL